MMMRERQEWKKEGRLEESFASVPVHTKDRHQNRQERKNRATKQKQRKEGNTSDLRFRLFVSENGGEVQ